VNKARRTSAENKFGWETMAERLVDRQSPKFQTLLEQGDQYTRLIEELSDLIKLRTTPTGSRLSAAWTMTVDHIFVTCGCLLG